MRNVLIAPNNGTSPLPKIFLLLLLQVVIGHGRIVVYQTTEGRMSELFEAQKGDKTAAGGQPSTSHTSTSDPPTPHIKALGFFVRGDVMRTPEEVRGLLSHVLNGTAAKRPNADSLTRQEDEPASPLRSSSHMDIPHLVKLGFGAANSRTVYVYPSRDGGDGGHRQLPSESGSGYGLVSGLGHVMAVGVGSFLGGLLVILLLFLVVVLRRRRARRLKSRDDDDDDGDPKSSLLCHEVAPPVDDVSNELSSGETSSDSSDSSDTCLYLDHIILSSLYQGQDRIRNLQTGPTRRDLTEDKSDSGSGKGRVCDKMTDRSNRSVYFTLEDDDEKVNTTPISSSPTSSSSSYLSSSNGNRSSVDSMMSLGHDDTTVIWMMPHEDMLCTRSVSTEGAIVSCARGDVILIVPPGAVKEECQFRIEVAGAHFLPSSSFPWCQIQKDTAGELVLSPVIRIQVCGSSAECFQEPITLKMPYRCLCSCFNGLLTLRSWDQSRSRGQIPPGPMSRDGVLRQHVWPECLDPEAGVPDRDGARASYNCFSNVCTIQTNMAATFCLTSRSSDHHQDSCVNQLYSAFSRYRDDNTRLCVAVGAKYYPDYGLQDHAGSVSYIRQITYTVCVSDNTACGRQQMEQFIRLSGGQVQCACVPIDVATGSEIKVAIASVHDSEWPWQMPFDSSSKAIHWKDVCSHYSSLAAVEFRCLPRSNDLLTLVADDVSIVNTFHIQTDQHTDQGLASIRINIVADSGYCC